MLQCHLPSLMALAQRPDHASMTSRVPFQPAGEVDAKGSQLVRWLPIVLQRLVQGTQVAGVIDRCDVVAMPSASQGRERVPTSVASGKATKAANGLGGQVGES